MSEPKFTPGPWKLEARRDICDEFECWLHPINLHIHDRISDEDAHLIAAAPELYKALMTVQYQCEIMANADWSKWEELASPEEFERWAKSRAAHMAALAQDALAKARGEE